MKESILPIVLSVPLLVKAEEKKNVIFILLDDLQSTAINFNGNDQVISPNIDEIFRNGVSYSNTYTNGALQGALSMPSRAMIMTGKRMCDLKHVLQPTKQA